MEIAYHRKGAGEPLLLLHGIGHHRQAFDPVLDRLAEHRDVIALDLPGSGESPDVPDGIPNELDTFAYAIDAFCTALDVDRPHVAGNSMGGLVALRMGQLGLARSVTARPRDPAARLRHVPMNDAPALVADTILETPEG
ncbi:alpha/beta fold hydrolase [Kribbella capetownensis]|uniref:alpha/beta fold hydrolase n=1 Tax=Kribbella capetownensis TaxID=1572659 RepID=UPI00192DF09A|nr:alpha/beta fold hydrolase [Kribbella capetownensis]